MKHVENITVCPSNKIIQIGKWYYGATANVCPCDADKPSVCWYSDNESVAAVNPNTGYIYGVSLGMARIYARACDGSGVEGYMTVTVAQNVPVERVTLNHVSCGIKKGNSITLVASVYPEDATNKSLTWCSSYAGIATVSNGVVCGIEDGETTVSVTSVNGKSASCTVRVTGDVMVSSVTLDKCCAQMYVGESMMLNATILPEDATHRSVGWESTNPDVATVNRNSGFVMAHKAGTATIIATALDIGHADAYCRIEVKNVPVSGVILSECDVEMNVGEEKKISATVIPSNATNKTLMWTSCDESIATVNNGYVNGKAEGNTVVTVRTEDGGFTASCNVRVSRVKVTGIHLMTSEIELDGNDSVRLTAVISPSNATDKKVTWKSNFPSIATVTQTGCVTGVSNGVARITVTANDGGYTASCTVNVKAVDTRERVTVEKDNEGGYEFFKVTFKNGLVWKSVGYDLSDMDTWIPQVAKNRSNQNLPKTFSEDQIAFLYLFDPLGITHYVKYYSLNHDYDLYKMMKFKDRIYQKIFGKFPRLIKILPDKQIRYYNYSETISDEARYSYYSDAEVLFGEHTIVDFISIMSFVLEVVPSVVTSIFGVKYDVLGNILSAIDLCKFVFFSGAVENIVSSSSTGTFEAYMEGLTNQKAQNRLKWANVALSGIETALNAAQVFVPSTDDIRIYDKVDLSNFQTRFSVNNLEISLQEIIENYN